MWNEYGDTNLHIVFGDTQNNDWASVNSAGWRTIFEPDLTYWLSIQSQLGSLYGRFGRGYVPFNIIIGPGYQVYLAGTGFDETASKNAIDKAIANFQFYPQNLISDQRYITNSEYNIDMSGVFNNQTGEQIVYSVESSSNPEVLDTSVNGSELTINTKDLTNTSELIIKGTAGTRTAYFKFNIAVYLPEMTDVFYESFETLWPTTGWTLKTTGLGWTQSSYAAKEGALSAYHANSSDSQNDWLYSPKVMITENSVLSFWQRGYYTELYYSHGIAISKDLIRYTWIYRDIPTSENWEQVFIDLSSYAGQEIYVGFNYQGVTAADRWFIDDVKVWDLPAGIENDHIVNNVKLFQNYPNPFNPSTEISFALDIDRSVKLSVLNSKGEQIINLFNGKLEKGEHKFNFNAEKLNSGIYFYTLEYEDTRLVNKMLLIK